jgi:acyl carrier protein
MNEEEELVIDPQFFAELSAQLPRISGVSTRVKRGRSDNELTRFRYDVLLTVDGAVARPSSEQHLDWTEQGLTPERLRRALEAPWDCVVIDRIPNARLASVRRQVAILAEAAPGQSAGDLRRAADEAPREEGVDPEALNVLAGEAGYHVDVTWSAAGGADGMCTAIFHRGPEAAAARPVHVNAAPRGLARSNWRAHANDPLHAAMTRQLVPSLRSFLDAKVPTYLVPSAFVVLESLPLSPNGKVDRRRLPAPDRARSDARTFVAPRTPAEEIIAGIFGDILGLDRVSVEESFFQLGGHSLLATQLVSRVRDKFGVEVLLRRVFEAPTVAMLAGVVEEALLEEIEAISEEEAEQLAQAGSDLVERLEDA